MIDLDKLESRCKEASRNGYGKHPVIECASAESIMELITRLRQAEKDAARYRWLKEVARHDYDIDDFFDGSCDRIDAKVDECIEVMQCK